MLELTDVYFFLSLSVRIFVDVSSAIIFICVYVLPNRREKKAILRHTFAAWKNGEQTKKTENKVKHARIV